jgi:isocitrate dehydrogenase
MGWFEAADKIIQGMSGAIAKGEVTYDLARDRSDAKILSCSAFGQAVIKQMR